MLEKISKSSLEKEASSSISRRDFFKKTGGGILASAVLGNGSKAALAIEDFLNYKKEVKNNFPNISVDIFYGGHATASDLEGFSKRVEDADVFVPEAIGWSMYKVNLLKLSQGKMSIKSFVELYTGESPSEGKEPVTFTEVMARAIYGTNKMIEIFDVPVDNPITDKTRSTLELVGEPDLSGNFENMIKLMRKGIIEAADVQKEREEYMLSRLTEFNNKVVNGEIEGLKSKKNIRLLLFLGAAHTGPYIKLSSGGNNIKRSFPSLPFIFNHGSEGLRRGIFKKNISDDLIAKIFIEKIISFKLIPELEAITPKSNLIVFFTRYVVDKFSKNDAENIFNKLKNTEYITNLNLEVIGQEMLREKGIKIPKNEEELIKMINLRNSR